MQISGCVTVPEPFIIQEVKLKVEIVQQSDLLIRSVDFLEAQIEQKLLEFEALESQYNFDRAEQVKQQVIGLLHRLHQEQKRLDSFISGWQQSIHEKKEILHSLGTKNSLPIRGLPSYSGGALASQRVSEETKDNQKSGLCHQIV